MSNPLSAEERHYHTHGGCWALAITLHEATGLPIELLERRDGPTHAYVADDEIALDARLALPI